MLRHEREIAAAVKIPTDMYTHCQLTSVKTDDSKTAVVKKQLWGHFISPATRQHTIMKKKTFSVRSVPRLCSWGIWVREPHTEKEETVKQRN
jgi:hypothetical protein